MANITLTFANDINVSLQKKGVSDTGQDIVYYGTPSNNEITSITRLGPCVDINTSTNSVTVDVGDEVVRPSVNDFIFFGKDNEAGTSGLLGYYAEVQMRNDSNSTSKIELFSVGSEIFESSK
mgnify:CR=1 FL=1|jgi:hypothetical protein